MNQKQRQQGDVRLTRLSKLPEGAIEIKPDERGIVVAEGERTGHYHAIKNTKNVRFYKLDELFIVNNENSFPVELEHQQHHPTIVAPGITEFGPIHEMDHLAQMERQVVD
jgi:hypothetical protein